MALAAFANTCKVVILNPKTIRVTAGAARDDVNGSTITLSSALDMVIDATAGAQAIDTGTVAASTLYAVYLIYGASPGTSVTFSTSQSSPTLPSGYTTWAFVGFVLTGADSQFTAGTNLDDAVATPTQLARAVGKMWTADSDGTNADTVTVSDAANDTTTFPLLATAATGSLTPATDSSLSYNANTGALTATTFVGALTGNADTVTVADAANDTTTFPLLGTAATGPLAPATDSSLTYNANTGALTATSFVGALTGNADTATTATTASSLLGTIDDTTYFFDGAATTKRARLDVGNVTAGQTRVISALDRDMEIPAAWNAIDFSGAPSSFTISPTGSGTLVVEMLLRSNVAVTVDDALLQFNGDAGGTYHTQINEANNGAANLVEVAVVACPVSGTSAPAGAHSYVRIRIPNFSGSALKAAMAEYHYVSSTTSLARGDSVVIRGTASSGAITDAITSLVVARASGNFANTSWGRWRVE
jgi:hypothetical protein